MTPEEFADLASKAGMTVVSQERFFAALYADKRDIMPSVRESPEYTPWLTKDRKEEARTYPGWKFPGRTAVYAIKDTLGKQATP